MKFSELFIRRPVFSAMAAASIVVLGVFSYFRLGVDLYPDVDFPYAVIQTTLPGASPEEIETSVTKVIEESVNTIEGIEDLTSISYEGLSVILIKFALEKDVDVAAQDTRDKVNAVLSQLPQGTETPVVGKFDVGSIPVLNIAFYGDMGLIDLTEIAKKKIKENIETVSGVGSVEMTGGREREIHVEVNPLKLVSLGIPIHKVKESISQQNIEIPGGRMENSATEFGVRTLGRIDNASDFANIVVATRNSAQIKISDIGTVKDTGEYARSISKLNGKPCITITAKKQSGANTVEVVKEIRERLETIKSSLPPSVGFKIIGDQSKYIKASVNSVAEHLVLGGIFATLMVLLFMGNFLSTIIAAIAIPTSVIGTFLFMQYAGFTLNNITLLGLTIAVGIVIDDAIVMLENIYRHMEELGKDPLKASIDGASEIGFAVLAISLSLLVIFVPLAYMGGIVGRFLKSYGLTVAFAVAISTFVALTVTPMMCRVFLRVRKGGKNKFEILADKVNDYLAEIYIVLLKWALNHKKTMVALSVALIISIAPMLKFIGKDFLPQEDTSQFAVYVTAPEGIALEKMQSVLNQLETDLRRVPHIKDVLSTAGVSGDGNLTPNEGSLTIELTGIKERSVSMQEIMSKIRKMFAKYTELRISISPTGGFGGGKDSDIQFVIAGPDLTKLQEYAAKVVNHLKKEKGIVDVDMNFSFAKPEYAVKIDRARAHDLGVKITDIASSIRTLVGGEEDITKFKDKGELYQVRLRAQEGYRNKPEIINSLPVPAEHDKVFRLDNVARVSAGFGPTKINRYNRQRQIMVTANLENYPLSRAIEIANTAFKGLNAPPEYTANVIGKSKEMGRMLKNFMLAFAMSFLFIYMVLASQFESFIYPLSIIVCLPLTIPFALMSIIFGGQTLGMFSIMGMFMLIGIVKKNSILQVDYTNTLRAQGTPRDEAVLEANRTRLRPILMTTLTLVASMIPTAFGTSEGSAVRRSMAWVIIGGQALSLLITLLMTPVTYVMLDDLQNKLKKKFGRAN